MYIPSSSALDIAYIDMNILLVLNVAQAVPVLGLHIILDVRSSESLFTVATIHVNIASSPGETVVLVTSTEL